MIEITWLDWDNRKCVLKMDGYDDLYSNDFGTLRNVANKRLLGKMVKVKLPKEKTYLQTWLYTHPLKYEIMDSGKHKGNYVVRSLKDRSKYWHLGPTDLIVIDEPKDTQLTIFDMEDKL